MVQAPTETLAGTPVPQFACQRPPDDYGRLQIDGWELNGRTYWMLLLAQTLYQGPGDLLRVTQGSYTPAEPGSFGTHDGGGAVDISIRHPETLEILWDEALPMVTALRQAGFAAWYRAPGDLGPNSAAHLHAIAVGDRDLSPPAADQLTAEWGYFRGMDGLPPEHGGPRPDVQGGPVLCNWMVELGYAIIRGD